jgi:hypothetical protein
MGNTIVLVACVKTKLAVPSPARELYCSDWFRKAASYARRLSDQWYILSAKHGLVHPDEVLAPYELYLPNLSAQERRRWARGVLDRLRPMVHKGDEVVILAGERYREHLVDALRAMGCSVRVPMAGLTQGRQLQWLGEQEARSDGRRTSGTAD